MSRNKVRGILLGLACGDALGRPVEFSSADTIERQHGTLDEMVGFGTWNQPAGTITDDTEQALCIARSLVDRDGFDPDDIAARFVDWYQSDPFDIGVMTAKSLRRLEQGEAWNRAGQAVWERSAEGSNAGNGSVMRCAPLSIPYRDDFETLAQVSRDSSRITHADPRCTHGCAVLNLTIAGLLNGASDPLADALRFDAGDAPAELVEALEPLTGAAPSLDLKTSGFVIHSLQTALHDSLHADSPEAAIVSAVNRGGDADTIGAITGAIAGARFGADALPDRWLDPIHETTELIELVDELDSLV